MASQRKRYYVWLFRAYFKRWKKTILGALALSIFVSLGLAGLIIFYLQPLIQDQEERIGYWGVYTVDTLPDEVIGQVSMGLTQVNEDGEVVPGAAERWDVADNKTYTFHLRQDLTFHDGRKFSTKTIPFNFENVKREVIDDHTIRFTLEEAYSPFLTSVARPIILKDLSGLGNYEMEDVDLNAGFVRSLTLRPTEGDGKKQVINFYPTQEALKIAFSLGEIDSAIGLHDTLLDGHDLATWPSVSKSESVDPDVMVTVFFNTADEILSEKRLRQALHYALPDTTSFGPRLYSPIPEESEYFAKPPNYGIADKELSRELLSAAQALEKPLKITAARELEETAKVIQKNWQEVGVESEIELVSEIPAVFQVLVYQMNVPSDPDQYILWHSDQRNNISNYKNLRIDKLLEDGRSTTDTEERQEIYADFQKYLMDDVPASFFYHPTAIRLVRSD